MTTFLTYEEYRDISGIVDGSTFTALYKIAARVLSYETSDYFDYHDFATTNAWIQNKYKEAIALQIDHMHTTKHTTTHEVNNQPTSFQLGRTNVSYGSSNQSTNNVKKSLTSDDVLMVLSNTGLLYRGGNR